MASPEVPGSLTFLKQIMENFNDFNWYQIINLRFYFGVNTTNTPGTVNMYSVRKIAYITKEKIAEKRISVKGNEKWRHVIVQSCCKVIKWLKTLFNALLIRETDIIKYICY